MKRKITYKKVKVLMPFCEVCNEQLSGNGSPATPYRCLEGVWESNWINPWEYEIVKEEV